MDNFFLYRKCVQKKWEKQTTKITIMIKVNMLILF